jgi:hypothetical protein
MAPKKAKPVGNAAVCGTLNAKVMADVLASCREELAGEGVDASVLAELQTARTVPRQLVARFSEAL